MTHPAHESNRINLVFELAHVLCAARPSWSGARLAEAVSDDGVWRALVSLVRPGREPSGATRAALVALLRQSGPVPAAESMKWETDSRIAEQLQDEWGDHRWDQR